MSKLGRNNPCPCGSGKKYKHCCERGRIASATPTPARRARSVPKEALAFFSEASALHAQGRLNEAVRVYRRGLAIYADVAEAYANLGSALDDLGRQEEAIECYRKALALRPASVEVHSNLGLALQALKRYDAAEESFKAAIALRKDYAPAYFNLGRLQQLQGRHAEAVERYRRVLDLQPQHAQARNNLAIALEAAGDVRAALAAYRQATVDDPKLVAAQRGLADALRRVVPAWHVPMMNDTARNDAYYAALRDAIGPQSHVLEIGTGAGLLSMMAARLGAAQVPTCEADAVVAETAQRIIAENGLSSKIRLVAKRSTEIQPGVDYPGPADILISEIFSSELLGERVLPSIEDARKRLVRPDCRVIPSAASVMVALFGGEQVARNLLVQEVYGFDLRAFNDIVPKRQTIVREDLDLRTLSDDVEAFRFDFETSCFWPPESKVLRVPVRGAGRCYGVVQWIRLQMDRNTVFENHPQFKAPAASWVRCAYLLPEAIDVVPGMTAIVSAVHNRVCPWFSVERWE